MFIYLGIKVSLLIIIFNIMGRIALNHKKKIIIKSSKFECGFDRLRKVHPIFSIQFFLICLIFIILDIEIILLIPSIVNLFSIQIMLSLLFFLIILTLGLKEEWKKGTMEWSY